MKHPTIVLINQRKWKTYAAFWFKYVSHRLLCSPVDAHPTDLAALIIVVYFRVRLWNYIVYLVSIVLMCLEHDLFQSVVLVWAVCNASWFLLDELSEFLRYVKTTF